MKVYFFLFLILAMQVSCSSKKITLNSADSIRGDAVVSKIIPDRNMGDKSFMHLYAWTQNGVLNVNRLFIDFDLRKLPTDRQIDKAILHLYYDSANQYYINMKHDKRLNLPYNFLIQRIISDWNEKTITWNTQPNVTNENQSVAVKVENMNEMDYAIDVTSLIKDMLIDENTGFGFMIRLENEEPYKAIAIAPSEQPDKKLHPKLEVFYHKK